MLCLFWSLLFLQSPPGGDLKSYLVCCFPSLKLILLPDYKCPPVVPFPYVFLHSHISILFQTYLKNPFFTGNFFYPHTIFLLSFFFFFLYFFLFKFKRNCCWIWIWDKFFSLWFFFLRERDFLTITGHDSSKRLTVLLIKLNEITSATCDTWLFYKQEWGSFKYWNSEMFCSENLFVVLFIDLI